jgi:hypothetical protein
MERIQLDFKVRQADNGFVLEVGNPFAVLEGKDGPEPQEPRIILCKDAFDLASKIRSLFRKPRKDKKEGKDARAGK